MALNYHLVKRPDMRKDAAAGSELYYAQVRALKKVSFEKLCSMIAMRSTAFIGDVMLVIEGLLSVMQERLEEGDIISSPAKNTFTPTAFDGRLCQYDIRIQLEMFPGRLCSRKELFEECLLIHAYSISGRSSEPLPPLLLASGSMIGFSSSNLESLICNFVYTNRINKVSLILPG